MSETPETSTPFVVVGLDDSPSALAALRFAADYARSSGADLHAIHVSSAADQVPVAWSPEYVGLGYMDFPDATARRDAMRTVFESVGPDPRWRLEFADGGYGQTLVDRAVGAVLLVVGTREHTGLGRILSGSVSHFCLSHAPCPVVAVPAESQPSRSAASTKSHVGSGS